jgi:predicted dinucleotide-binding enzyme
MAVDATRAARDAEPELSVELHSFIELRHSLRSYSLEGLVMKIAIIGAGSVGQALAMGWRKAGHDVRFGVRDTSRDRGEIPAVSVADAVAASEIVVMATPWPDTRAAIESAGDLTGRIVIDCTNPLGGGPQGLHLVVGFETSAGEQVAQWARGASVFKTLNQAGANVMADARAFGPPAPVMFVAGDDAARKPAVLSLVADLGFEALDAGPLRNARLLEPFAMLWIDQALVRGAGRDFAFAISRRRG